MLPDSHGALDAGEAGWYEAKVLRQNADGSYHIEYDDLEQWESAPADALRAVGKSVN